MQTLVAKTKFLPVNGEIAYIKMYYADNNII